ncbi:MAG TPA: hypothetical protein VLW49_01955 [Gaiellaceae bacterium]|nr:hypothetical protein [Gaiellaceae bacterium]
MEGDGRRARARDFLIGGLVGASAAVAAARRRRTLRRRREERLELPAGLAAFEGAPCFEELLEQTPETPPAA